MFSITPAFLFTCSTSNPSLENQYILLVIPTSFPWSTNSSYLKNQYCFLGEPVSICLSYGKEYDINLHTMQEKNTVSALLQYLFT